MRQYIDLRKSCYRFPIRKKCCVNQKYSEGRGSGVLGRVTKITAVMGTGTREIYNLFSEVISRIFYVVISKVSLMIISGSIFKVNSKTAKILY